MSYSEYQLPLNKTVHKKDIDECVLTLENSFKKVAESPLI